MCRNGRYLTSNVNITLEVDGQAVSKPVGEQYAKFETKQSARRLVTTHELTVDRGRRVTAFGIIFNCELQDFGTVAHEFSLGT